MIVTILVVSIETLIKYSIWRCIPFVYNYIVLFFKYCLCIAGQRSVLVRCCYTPRVGVSNPGPAKG